MRRSRSRALLIPGLLVLALLGPLVAASWYSFSLQRQSLSDSIDFEAEQLIQTLAHGMVDPVWNLIPDAGRPLVDSLLQTEHVVGIEVESTAQGPFLVAEKPNAAEADLLTLEHDIVRNGEVIGHATVRLDTGLLYAEMNAQWRQILFISLGQALLVLAIVLWVFRLNSRLERAAMTREANERLEHEIVERKQAEDRAKENRDQLALVTDNLPVSIAFVDANGRLLFANEVWHAWNDLVPAETAGQPVEILRARDYEIFRPYIDGVMAGAPQEFEARIAYEDGKRRDVRIRYVPHSGPSGAVEGYFALAEDVTEVKAAEERQRQAQKLEAIGRLTGGIAHDFNNLLAVVQGNAELLTDEVGDSNRHVEAILRASGRAAELTQHMLAYSRQQPLRPEPFDPAQIVNSITRQLASDLGSDIELATALDDDLWQVMADAGQVQEAMVNLALNALEAMPDGGRLTISCRNAQLSEAPADYETTVSGDFVALTVSDTGKGMTEEVRSRASEPFFTTKEVGEGSGLGLSMVEGFARQSGGQLTIESTPGEGTSVTLYLPRVAPGRAAAPHHATASADRRPEVILVVEDDADVRSLTVGMLTSLGYRVIDVPDAESAERVLMAGERVDLALSDVVLPGGMSGPQFIAVARKRYPDLRVVFMSGYSADALSADAHLPADDECVLLSKPFQRSQLAQTISSALAQSH